MRNRTAGTTERVSVATDGSQANWGSGQWSLAMSANGRYVVFDSWASNLLPDDTNGTADVFVRGPLSAASPYTTYDIVEALRASAGLMNASAQQMTRLNLEAGGSSAGRVDLADALRLARKVFTLEPNP